MMKALVAALVLVALMSAPTLAQRGYGGNNANQSPASPSYGGNGY
jgi:uncharacterized protein YdeI (BOF family)